MRNSTLHELAAALAYLPPDCPRDEWVKAGMALHSAYPGDDGFTVFDTWSQGASTYDAQACRATWKSFKHGKGNGLGIGTLLAEAKRHGWQPNGVDTGAPPNPADLEAKRKERERLQAQAERDEQAAHAKAADMAEAAYSAAQASGASPYLTRKGIDAHCARFESGSRLVVPLYDGYGKLLNVQRIAPDGTKRFLKGGRKAGLWCWLGEPQGAPVLAIAEGFATAASVFEATSYPCAVAFDCGNLGKVARSIRGLFPDVRMVIAADDDAANHMGGKNPGLDAAREAAKTIRGLVAIPQPLPAGGTDFNDLMCASGKAAVAACFEAALREADRAGASATTPTADRFTLADDGVWCEITPHRGKPYQERLCAPLEVLARTRDADGSNWGRLLRFNDPKGKQCRVMVPDTTLQGERSEWCSILARFGFESPLRRDLRQYLAEYIRSRPVTVFAKEVRRIGWHDGAVFVLPDGTVYGAAAEPYLLHREGSDYGFKVKGSLDDWRAGVARYCVGNSRLAFAVSCAFAGVLLDLLKSIPGGGFHYFGGNGAGKSTCLYAAASVWTDSIMPWRATDSALEWVSAMRCDTFLPLDELKQIEPQALAQAVYMLANGQGKSRSNQGGANRPQHAWRVLFLSTGEMRLEDRIKDAPTKTRVYGGQEVRMPDIPADAGAGLGAFECLHGFGSGEAFAKAVALAKDQAHGNAGPAFAKWCVERRDDLQATIHARVTQIVKQIVPEGASNTVKRTGERFALVALAGEWATEAGITGWQDEEAIAAAQKCLGAWLATRGGLEDAEELQALRQVQRVTSENQRSRFIPWTRVTDDRSPNVANALGYWRMIGPSGKAVLTDSDYQKEYGGDEASEQQMQDSCREFCIFPWAWREVFCQGFDAERVRQLLRDRSYLVHDRGKLTMQLRSPGSGGRKETFVVIPASILSAEF
jgi:putative DNA primase/helicase